MLERVIIHRYKRNEDGGYHRVVLGAPGKDADLSLYPRSLKGGCPHLAGSPEMPTGFPGSSDTSPVLVVNVEPFS